MSIPFLSRFCAAVLALEGIAIIALAVLEIAAILRGDIESLAGAWGLVVLFLAWGAVVIVFAIACLRGASWGRSGGILTQLMMLAVALGAATGDKPDYGYAVMLAIPALLMLVALFTLTSRLGRAAQATPEAPESAEAS